MYNMSWHDTALPDQALMLRRSLGMTLLEAGSGQYPYDASGGPLQLMIQVQPATSPQLLPY